MMTIHYRQIPYGFFHVLLHHSGGLRLGTMMELAFATPSVMLKLDMRRFLLPSSAILGGMLGTLILIWKCSSGGILHHNLGRQLSAQKKIFADGTQERKTSLQKVQTLTASLLQILQSLRSSSSFFNSGSISNNALTVRDTSPSL